MAFGERTWAGMRAQPGWLRQVSPDRRLPAGARVLFTGCGSSYHAAQTAGEAVQALELVLRAERDADVLVLVSHEGETRLTLESARVFRGERWLVTAKPASSLGRLADVVVRAAPEADPSFCHTAAYTCAVAALAALRGEEVGWLAGAVEDALAAPPEPVSEHARWLVAGAGRDWATAQEAVLKLREGAHVAGEAHQTEELLHGHLAAIDESVRCFVLEGEGRGAERAGDAVAALRELGCDVTLVATRHPVVDIVRFQRLTVDLAAARGVDPDLLRRDDERWARARAAYA